MDTKDAIMLIESGRYEELSDEDIMHLYYTLSSSAEQAAVSALITFRQSRIGNNLPQISMNLHNLIESNYRAVHKVENEVSLFALDNAGRPQSKEILSIFNFFSRVEVENKAGAENVKAENLFSQAAEIARTSALKDLYLDKNFAKRKQEEQKKAYIDAVVMAMEETAFVLLSNQVLENVADRKRTTLTAQEKNQIKSEVERRFAACIDVNSKARFKLSNNNIIGTFVAEVNRNDNNARFLEEAAKNKRFAKDVQALDEKLAPHYQNTFLLLRPLAPVPNMGIIAGHVGKSSFAASNIAEAVRTNNPAKKNSKLSLFAFLREQPRQLKAFSENIVGSLKRIYNGLMISAGYDIISSKIATGWNKLVRRFSSHAEEEEGKTSASLSKDVVMQDLKDLNGKLSKALNSEPSPADKVYAWKEFGAAFRNSQLGRVLNPERTVLVSERPQDYTKVVKIPLGKSQAAMRSKTAPVKRGEGIPRIVGAQIRRLVSGNKAK